MRCRVQKSSISGEIDCPPSKSYTHRAAFIASLAGGGSRVDNALISADTEATIRACRCLGADLAVEGASIAVRGPIRVGAPVPEIDAANSGTTIRIAAGIAGLFRQEITLTGDRSLRGRPMRPLLDALESMGAECSSDGGTPPVRITGRIRGGDVSVPGGVSSQFISSLLICAPLTEDGISLSVDGDPVSRPYIDATVSSMAAFGVGVRTMAPYRRYRVDPQAYRPAAFGVPADFSSIALLLSAAVLNGRGVTINGGAGGLPQGDEAFIGMLGRMGVAVRAGGPKISVGAQGRLGGGRFDLGDSPDLLPALAILALKASEPIEIVNVGHARAKETDRIAVLCRELAKVGVAAKESRGGMVLEPAERPRGADLDPENDHRLFMAFCIAGMFVGGCTVGDPESAAVSYPGFIAGMRGAGAEISVG